MASEGACILGNCEEVGDECIGCGIQGGQGTGEEGRLRGRTGQCPRVVRHHSLRLHGTSITAVFYPGEGLSAQLMTWATFAITFVVRPLGAVIIGRYADKHGRKAALSLTIGLMTLGVFIIVVLPGESVLGIWAAIILIIARVIQGISAGGEFGSATAFLTENAKRGKAFYASFQTATQGISMFLAAGV